MEGYYLNKYNMRADYLLLTLLRLRNEGRLFILSIMPTRKRKKSKRVKRRARGVDTVSEKEGNGLITSSAPGTITRRSSFGGGSEQIQAYQLLVPLFMTVIFTGFLLLSFWPVYVLTAPFQVFLIFPASLLMLFIYLFFFDKHKFLQAWALFLLPWHAFFITIAVAVFSFWWALAVGVLMFVQGEVLWDRGNYIHRWERCVSWFDQHSSPIFEYFPMTLSFSTRKPRKTSVANRKKGKRGNRKKYMFCYHPHGVYAFGIFNFVFGDTSGFKAHFPDSAGVLVGVANALLHIPIVGTLFSYFGFIPASKKSLEEACGTEYDLVVVPGGIAEMTKYHPDKEVLYLKARFGFIRMALKHGRSVVPVYGFGENNTFVVYRWFKRLRERMSRKFRMSLVLFRGRGPTLIPLQVPLNVVCGKPMDLPKIPDPSDFVVQYYHKEYLTRIEQLYEAHKSKHPFCKDKPLEII